jgi:hypothetical protein
MAVVPVLSAKTFTVPTPDCSTSTYHNQYSRNWAGHVASNSDYSNQLFTWSESQWPQPNVPADNFTDYKNAPTASFWTACLPRDGGRHRADDAVSRRVEDPERQQRDVCERQSIAPRGKTRVGDAHALTGTASAPRRSSMGSGLTVPAISLDSPARVDRRRS